MKIKNIKKYKVKLKKKKKRIYIYIYIMYFANVSSGVLTVILQ